MQRLDPRASRRPVLTVRIAVVLVLSLLLGGLTSFAQGFLPDWFASFANSASGWTLLTVLLVSVARVPLWLSAVLGAAGFALLTVGYAVVSTMRGYFYDPLMFSLVSVLAGPVVGIAACWLREWGWKAALATIALAGVGLGDAAYGLLVVGDTTSPVYWTLIGAAALGLIIVMATRRLRTAATVAVAVLGSAAVATAYVGVFASQF